MVYTAVCSSGVSSPIVGDVALYGTLLVASVGAFSLSLLLSTDYNALSALGSCGTDLCVVSLQVVLLMLYLHMGRCLWYASPSSRSTVWTLGVAIYLLVAATCFTGYSLGTYPWSGSVVCSATFSRFFSAHYLLPLVIIAVVLAHVLLLYMGSTGDQALVSPRADTVNLASVTLVLNLLLYGTLVLGWYTEVLGHVGSLFECYGTRQCSDSRSSVPRTVPGVAALAPNSMGRGRVRVLPRAGARAMSTSTVRNAPPRATYIDGTTVLSAPLLDRVHDERSYLLSLGHMRLYEQLSQGYIGPGVHDMACCVDLGRCSWWYWYNGVELSIGASAVLRASETELCSATLIQRTTGSGRRSMRIVGGAPVPARYKPTLERSLYRRRMAKYGDPIPLLTLKGYRRLSHDTGSLDHHGLVRRRTDWD